MRLQLAGTAKERGEEAANSLSRRDLGASKYPPRAKRVRVCKQAPAHFLYRSPGIQEGTIVENRADNMKGNATASTHSFVVRAMNKCSDMQETDMQVNTFLSVVSVFNHQ